MKSREIEQHLHERQRLLEIEAGLQRAALAATFAKWQDHKLLTVGSTLATWSWKLLALPRIRWLVFGTLLAKLRSRRKNR